MGFIWNFYSVLESRRAEKRANRTMRKRGMKKFSNLFVDEEEEQGIASAKLSDQKSETVTAKYYSAAISPLPVSSPSPSSSSSSGNSQVNNNIYNRTCRRWIERIRVQISRMNTSVVFGVRTDVSLPLSEIAACGACLPPLLACGSVAAGCRYTLILNTHLFYAFFL